MHFIHPRIKWVLQKMAKELLPLLNEKVNYLGIVLTISHKSRPTLCDPMDHNLPGSSVHEIFQARILEWVAISFSRRSSQPRDWTRVSGIVGRRFTIWATREVRIHALLLLRYFICARHSCQVTLSVGSQREELRPWQRSWGRKLGIRKGVIKPQENPCSWASTPKSEYFTGSSPP